MATKLYCNNLFPLAVRLSDVFVSVNVSLSRSSIALAHRLLVMLTIAQLVSPVAVVVDHCACMVLALAYQALHKASMQTRRYVGIDDQQLLSTTRTPTTT